jgi:hypothetical protein
MRKKTRGRVRHEEEEGVVVEVAGGASATEAGPVEVVARKKRGQFIILQRSRGLISNSKPSKQPFSS